MVGDFISPVSISRLSSLALPSLVSSFRISVYYSLRCFSFRIFSFSCYFSLFSSFLLSLRERIWNG